MPHIRDRLAFGHDVRQPLEAALAVAPASWHPDDFLAHLVQVDLLLARSNDLLPRPGGFRHGDTGCRPLCVEQDDIVFPVEEPGQIHEAEGIVPYDLVAEILRAEDGIHEQLEVVAGGVVAVQVDAAGWFEESFHFHDTDGHVDQVAHHGVAVDGTGGIQQGVESGMLVLDFAVPGEVDVVKPPCVLESGAGGPAADRCGVVGVGIEGGVEVYQVDRGTVHAPHDVQVVTGPYGLVGPVEIRGGGNSLVQIPVPGTKFAGNDGPDR